MSAALLITGAPGSGESSVLEALATMLEIEGAEHGAIESEELTRGFPPLGNELLAEQLERVIERQRAAGRRLFLIAFTAESAGQLRSLLAATGVERALVVCLRAHEDELAGRLERREGERWSGKRGLIAHARELAAVAPALAGVDVVVDTAGRAPWELAGELRAAMRERGLA